jgi:hypothetical protein
LRLVLQLAENPFVTATVVHFDVAEAVLGEPTSSEQDAAFFASLGASLPAERANRVVFETVVSVAPVADVIARARIEVEQSPRSAGDLIVLGRNIARNGVLERQGTADGTRSSLGAAGTLGVLAERAWEGELGASMLVVKAGCDMAF